MSKVPSRGELILYRTEDGRDTIRLRDDTVWLTPAEHQNYNDSVVKQSLTTADDQDDGATCKNFLQVQPERLARPEAGP